jgi:hypothetical protein
MLRHYFQVSLSLIILFLSLSHLSLNSKILICMFQKPDCHGIEVYIPGSEIPKWFKHQSVGASMEFLEEEPSDFMGIAMCAVFVRHHQSPSKISKLSLDWRYSLIADTEYIGRWSWTKNLLRLIHITFG